MTLTVKLLTPHGEGCRSIERPMFQHVTYWLGMHWFHCKRLECGGTIAVEGISLDRAIAEALEEQLRLLARQAVRKRPTDSTGPPRRAEPDS